MAAEEPAQAIGPVDVADGCENAEPAAGIFCELGRGGLEEDLDPIEGADYSFGLRGGLEWEERRNADLRGAN